MNLKIDGAEFHSEEELHSLLAEGLQFPDYYGKNLDALWDCLSGWIDDPTSIVWTNFSVSRQRLSNAEAIVSLMREAEPYGLHLEVHEGLPVGEDSHGRSED